MNTFPGAFYYSQEQDCLQVRDTKWGALGASGRLASAKLVIHVKYGIFIIKNFYFGYYTFRYWPL